jgi:hypothetical protein
MKTIKSIKSIDVFSIVKINNACSQFPQIKYPYKQLINNLFFKSEASSK